MQYLLLLLLFVSTWANSASFMPENTMHLNPPEAVSDMTEEEFVKIVDDIVAFYAPEATRLGKTLVSSKLWSNNTVNAYATQLGNTWKVAMFGGLARRPEVTADGFALVVCHELGHHFGGYPLYRGEWASTEGNSDYWATQACARRVWATDASKNRDALDDVDEHAKARCDESWASIEDRNLCYRIANGSYGLAKLLSRGGNQPEFDTPDETVVIVTNPRHPKGQCRLDTYFAGALCKVSHRDDFITGRFNPNGQDGIFAEHEALANSCTNRPKCWFKSLL